MLDFIFGDLLIRYMILGEIIDIVLVGEDILNCHILCCITIYLPEMFNLLSDYFDTSVSSVHHLY